uniref:Uncharacterized protein n=1 Tax=Ditylenchus dipsaci TaxID=166011 RepID=A0A915E5B2_9BILA
MVVDCTSLCLLAIAVGLKASFDTEKCSYCMDVRGLSPDCDADPMSCVDHDPFPHLLSYNQRVAPPFRPHPEGGSVSFPLCLQRFHGRIARCHGAKRIWKTPYLYKNSRRQDRCAKWSSNKTFESATGHRKKANMERNMSSSEQPDLKLSSSPPEIDEGLQLQSIAINVSNKKMIHSQRRC